MSAGAIGSDQEHDI